MATDVEIVDNFEMTNQKIEPCDILVVGGGIHGVGVAQAAAAAGYKVVLVEKSALAAGTSSKSSKLIHGGLRYLESAEIGLVRESLRERELLIKIAPDLVKRQQFYIPVYGSTKRGAWTIRAGLSMYAVLAGMGSSVRFRKVPRSEWGSLDGLSLDDLKTVFQYSDAQTDDRLLTTAVMRSAEELGARLLCPAEFLSASIESGECRAQLRIDGNEHQLNAKAIVNAAGPWANSVLERITPRQSPFPVDNVQGTHLELPGEVKQGGYYMEMPQDQRAVFVLPWKGRVMLGTTEHMFDGDPANVCPLEQETEYLLEGYRQFFPGRSTEVLDAWSGLRVLPKAQGKDGAAFKRSRETQLPTDRDSKPRLVSIFGGKLTGYRATALKVVEQFRATLPGSRAIADTSELRLSTPVETTASAKPSHG